MSSDARVDVGSRWVNPRSNRSFTVVEVRTRTDMQEPYTEALVERSSGIRSWESVVYITSVCRRIAPAKHDHASPFECPGCREEGCIECGCDLYPEPHCECCGNPIHPERLEGNNQ